MFSCILMALGPSGGRQESRRHTPHQGLARPPCLINYPTFIFYNFFLSRLELLICFTDLKDVAILVWCGLFQFSPATFGAATNPLFWAMLEEEENIFWTLTIKLTCRIVGEEYNLFLSPELQLFCGKKENWSRRTDVPFLFPSLEFIRACCGRLQQIVSWEEICQTDQILQNKLPSVKAATTSPSLPVILFTVETL